MQYLSKRTIYNGNIFSPNFLTNITTAINININVDDIDKLNMRKLHELMTTVDYVVGSILHSDEWKDYSPLRSNPDYTHASVNHSKYFVDPVTGVHTQSIENIWMRVKRKQKKQAGICN